MKKNKFHYTQAYIQPIIYMAFLSLPSMIQTKDHPRKTAAQMAALMRTNNKLRRHCIPCHSKNVKKLSSQQAINMLKNHLGWQLSGGTVLKIYKNFSFKDFDATMQFVNEVADIAQAQGHHPDLHVTYDHVKLEIYTHAIQGLSSNDFILATLIDELKK